MTDEPSLLDQLRIDRAPKPKRSSSRFGWLVLLILLIAGGAGGAWWWQQNETGVPVKIAYARAIAGSGQSSAGASMLDASGYIVAHRQATISSLQVIGLVTALPVEEGEHVEAGQVLAKLDDRDLQAQRTVLLAAIDQAKASLAQAQAALADATPIFERDRTEEARGLISAEAFETEQSSYDGARTAVAVQNAALANARASLQANDTSLSEDIVRAPFAGVITQLNTQIGDSIAPTGYSQTGIATLVDMNSLEAQVDVSETYINRVTQDQEVTIILNAYPDWQIPGHVIAVIPTADKTTATVTVRVALGVKDQRILPNMGVHVSFLEAAPTEGTTPQGALVERDAVQENTGGSSDSGTVFVIDGDHVQARNVTLGARDGDDETILSGLAAGESVAVGDLTQLADGKKVRVTQ